MIMGPVFRGELLRTARRGRYYVLRFVYGSILLFLVWSGYQQMFWQTSTATIAAVASFAERTFITFATVQLIAILILVPAIFGGSIVDEKQRKTLHYLMASQLSSAEIVLDKVLGRLPHLGAFLAIGLPIVSILGLFGGISRDDVIIAYVGTCSTATFAVATTVLVSTLLRGVRPAILSSYLLVLAWLVLPPLITLFGSLYRPAVYFWVSPINDWLTDSSPFGVWIRSLFRTRRFGVSLSSMRPQVEWMASVQVAGATALLLVAIWRLRPTFRRQVEIPAHRTWFGLGRGRRRGPRRFARPDCGNDAILWKERYFAPADRFTRMVLLPAIVAVTLPLALITESQGDFSGVVWDLWQHKMHLTAHQKESLVWSLQVDLGWYSALWLLAVAGSCASSVTIEREEDTWVSLTATPLTGWEILRAKALGAVWNQRGFGAVLIFLWIAGLVTGAVYPPGILASIAVVAILTWLVAVVGIHTSLRSTNTSRSLASTILAVGLFNGYQFIFVVWFLGGVWLLGEVTWNSSFAMLGGMPMLAAGPVVTHRFAAEGTWKMADLSSVPASMPMPVALTLLATYALAATWLTIRVVKGFDRWLDRPPMSGAARPRVKTSAE